MAKKLGPALSIPTSFSLGFPHEDLDKSLGKKSLGQP